MNLHLDPLHLQRWWQDDGDNSLICNYNLNQDSTVMDLGGYTGVWAKKIIDRFDCNVYVIEPLTEFYQQMVEKFQHNQKVHLLNAGIAPIDKKDYIYLNQDSTSSTSTSGEKVLVEYRSIHRILSDWNLSEIDLLQMNIEGDEYPVLESMIIDQSILKFKNIQVQFHLGVPDDINKHTRICNKLYQLGFRLRYSYPFVWESWIRTDYGN